MSAQHAVLQGHHRNCVCDTCNGSERHRVVTALKGYAESGHAIGRQALNYIDALEAELESFGKTIPRLRRQTL